MSWVPAAGVEQLYLSPASRFGGGAAIRGGVPVIFPQFAERGGGPRHGFARTTKWELEESHGGADFACATLFLEDSAATRAHWPHAFRAELTVAVSGARLDIELEVENRGTAPFDFTAALHTYLRVAEVETVCVEGLQGHSYEDNAAGGASHIDRAETLVVGGEAAGAGVAARTAATAVAIPMQSAVESLNAAVAGSIILFEAARQRRV